MNQPFKKLREQALKDVDHMLETEGSDHVVMHQEHLNMVNQRFAELIVQECIDITNNLVDRNTDGTWTSNELYTDYNGALFEVKRRIKEHFGVQE